MKKHLTMTSQGFTIMEVVVVLMVVGILAVVVNPQWVQTSMVLQYEARQVLNDIRYAQAMSLATGQRYRWVRTSSTSYQITNEAGTAIVLPDGGTAVTLSNGISFGSFTNLPSNLVAFDTTGAPYTTSSLPGTALASTATIPVTSSSATQNITITPTTGYGALQ